MKQVTDISEIEIIREWTDDFLTCAEVSFKDQDGEARKVELWWVGETIAAFWYAHESQTAKQDAIEAINEQLQNDEADAKADAKDADDAMGDPNP